MTVDLSLFFDTSHDLLLLWVGIVLELIKGPLHLI